MPTKPKTTQVPFIPNDNLPTLYVDGLQVDHRDDGMILFRFTSRLPEGHKEQVRLMISEKDLTNMEIFMPI